jgi:hypothetical protein
MLVAYAYRRQDRSEIANQLGHVVVTLMKDFLSAEPQALRFVS